MEKSWYQIKRLALLLRTDRYKPSEFNSGNVIEDDIKKEKKEG